MIRIFNYPGCKANFIQQLDPLVSRAANLGCSSYVEPFCGTASVLINCAGRTDFGVPMFQRLHASDLSREVLTILSAFRDGEYEALVRMYDSIRLEFGSIREKEAYYAFRDEYNRRYFGSGTVEEGFFLHVAARAAINSMFRVGPNGFNQASGLRGDSIALTPSEFAAVKHTLSRTDLARMDYMKRFSELDSDDTLWFLDPPYELRPVQGSYHGESEFSGNDFISAVKSLRGRVIYTDVYSEDILRATGFNYSTLGAKKNISPGRNTGAHDYIEAVYYNF